MKAKFTRDLLSTFTRQIVGLLLALSLSIILARLLGPAGNGIYALAILLPNLLVNSLNMGLPPANAYYISRGEIPLRAALRTNFRLWTILSSGGVLIAFVLIRLAGEELLPGVPGPVIWIALLGFPAALLQVLLVSMLQGKRAFGPYNLSFLVITGGTIAAAIGLIWIADGGAVGAAGAFVSGHLLGLLFTYAAVRRIGGTAPAGPRAPAYLRRCLSYGWRAHISNMMTFLIYRADVWLLNFFLGPLQTGIYVVAVQLAERVWTLSRSVVPILLPEVAQLHADDAQRKVLTPAVGRLTFVGTLISAALLTLLTKALIHFLFGSEYGAGAAAVFWLLPGITLFALSSVYAGDLAARGRPELNMYLSFGVVALNIILNLLLIPRLGIQGAAIATSIAYSADTIARTWIYMRISGNRLADLLKPQPGEVARLLTALRNWRTRKGDGRVGP